MMWQTVILIAVLAVVAIALVRTVRGMLRGRM